MTDRLLILDEPSQLALQKILEMWPSAEALVLLERLHAAPPVVEGWSPFRAIARFFLRRRELRAFKLGQGAGLIGGPHPDTFREVGATYDLPPSVVQAYRNGFFNAHEPVTKGGYQRRRAI